MNNLYTNYAHQLKKYYMYFNGELIFDDGVKYTIREVLLLANPPRHNTSKDLQFIHEIKKCFGGSIYEEQKRGKP